MELSRFSRLTVGSINQSSSYFESTRYSVFSKSPQIDGNKPCMISNCAKESRRGNEEVEGHLDIADYNDITEDTLALQHSHISDGNSYLLQGNIKKYESQINAYEKQLGAKSVLVETLTAENCELLKQLQDEQQKCKSLQETISSISQHMQHIVEENGILKSTDAMCIKLQEDLQVTKEKLQVLYEKCSIYEKEITKLQSKNVDLTSRNESLEQELRSSRQIIDDISEKYNQIDVLCKEKLNECKYLSGENSSLHLTIEELKKSMEISKVTAVCSKETQVECNFKGGYILMENDISEHEGHLQVSAAGSDSPTRPSVPVPTVSPDESVQTDKEQDKKNSDYEAEIFRLKTRVCDLQHKLHKTTWKKDFFLVIKTVLIERLKSEIEEKSKEIKKLADTVEEDKILIDRLKLEKGDNAAVEQSISVENHIIVQELQLSLQKLKDQIHELSIERENKNVEIQKFMTQLQESQGVIQDLTSSIKNQNNTILNLNSKLKEYEHNMQELSAQISNKDMEIQRDETKLIESQIIVHKLVSTVKDRDTEIQNLMRKLEECENERNKLSVDNEFKDAEVRELVTKSRESEKKIDELKSNSKFLDTEIQNLTLKLEDCRQQINTLSTLNDDKDMEIQRYVAKEQESEKKVGELMSCMKEQDGKMQELTSKLNKYEQQIHKLSSENNRMNSNIEAYEVKLQEIHKQNENLISRVKEQDSKIQNLILELKDSERKICKLSAENDIKENEIKKHMSELIESRAKVELMSMTDQSDEVRSLNEKLKQSDVEIEVKNTELQELSSQLQNCPDQVDKLISELETKESSIKALNALLQDCKSEMVVLKKQVNAHEQKEKLLSCDKRELLNSFSKCATETKDIRFQFVELQRQMELRLQKQETLQQELTELTHQLEVKNEELTHVKDKCIKLESCKDNCEKEIHQLKREIKAMGQSMSAVNAHSELPSKETSKNLFTEIQHLISCFTEVQFIEAKSEIRSHLAEKVSKLCMLAETLHQYIEGNQHSDKIMVSTELISVMWQIITFVAEQTPEIISLSKLVLHETNLNILDKSKYYISEMKLQKTIEMLEAKVVSLENSLGLEKRANSSLNDQNYQLRKQLSEKEALVSHLREDKENAETQLGKFVGEISFLKSKHLELEEKMNDLHEELLHKESMIQNLSNDNESLHSSLITTKQSELDIVNYENMVKTLQDDSKVKSDIIKDLNQKIKEKVVLITQHQENVEKKSREIYELKNIIQDYSKHIEQKDSRSVLQLRKISNLENQEEKMQAVISSLKLEKKHLEEHCTSLKKQLTDKQIIIDELSQVKQDFSVKLESIQEQLKQMEHEKNDANISLAELMNKIMINESCIKHLKDDEQKLQRQINEYDIRYRELQTVLKGTEVELAVTKDTCKEKDLHVNTLQKQLQDVLLQKEKLEISCQRNADVLSKYKMHFESSSKQVSSQSEALKKKSDYIAQLEGKLHQLNSSFDALKVDLNVKENLKSEFAALSDENDKLKLELKLKSELINLQNLNQKSKSGYISYLKDPTDQKYMFIKNLARKETEKFKLLEKLHCHAQENNCKCKKVTEKLIAKQTEIVHHLQKAVCELDVELNNQKLEKPFTSDSETSTNRVLLHVTKEDMRKLLSRKWSMQKHLLKLHAKLFEDIPISQEYHSVLLDHFKTLYSKVTPITLQEICEQSTDSASGNFSGAEMHQLYLSLQSDCEFFKNIHNLLEYFIIPITKHLASMRFKPHSTADPGKTSWSEDGMPPKLEKVFQSLLDVCSSGSQQFPKHEELGSSPSSSSKSSFPYVQIPEQNTSVRIEGAQMFMEGNHPSEPVSPRSNYSSPDLGIESDPNQDPSVPTHIRSGDVCALSRDSLDSRQLHCIEERWSSLIHAIASLEDFELLRKEVQECVVGCRAITSRAREGLKVLTGSSSPKKLLECSTLRGILDSCTDIDMCLAKVQVLINSFWYAPHPYKEDRRNYGGLWEENVMLKKVNEELNAKLKGNEEELMKFKTKEEINARYIAKTLVDTRKILRQSKNTLEQKLGKK